MTYTYYTIIFILAIVAVIPWLFLLLGVAEVKLKWPTGMVVGRLSCPDLITGLNENLSLHVAAVIDRDELWNIIFKGDHYYGRGRRALNAKLWELQNGT
jgi:hypothetical protein